MVSQAQDHLTDCFRKSSQVLMYHKDSCYMKTEKFCLKGFWVCAKLCMPKYWSVTLVMQSIHRMMETESLTEGLHSKYWFRSWTIQIFLWWPPSAAYAYGVILHLITSFFTVLDAKNLLRTCIIVVYGGSSWGFKLITSQSLVPCPLLVSSLMPNELHQWSCLEHKICCWCHPNNCTLLVLAVGSKLCHSLLFFSSSFFFF